jgi:hypothetical protein
LRIARLLINFGSNTRYALKATLHGASAVASLAI